MHDFTGLVSGLSVSPTGPEVSFSSQDASIEKTMFDWMEKTYNYTQNFWNKPHSYKENLIIGDKKFIGCFPINVGTVPIRKGIREMEVTMNFDMFESIENSEIYTLEKNGQKITYEVKDDNEVVITTENGVVKRASKAIARQIWKLDVEDGWEEIKKEST